MTGLRRRVLGAGAGGLALAAALIAAAAFLFPPSLHRLAAHGRIIRDRAGTPIAFYEDPGGEWKFPTAAGAVDPLLVRMLIGIENKRFYADPGVDPLAVARAAVQLLIAGHVVSGASTLTMQVARLLHPAPRTLPVKIVEAFHALGLTERFSKRDILGMWLSLAPFGGNIVGARAAALRWFGHSPRVLSPAEAALLIALCRRPEALRPDRHPRAATEARNRLLAEAQSLGLLTAAKSARARLTSVPRRQRPLPRQSPQITSRLASGARTTLDFRLNAAVAGLARARLASLPGASPGASSLAILVVGARSRAIRAAYAGAYGNPRRAGFVDLTRAIRSPGSALKPFLYGLAFADGLARPDGPVSDAPRQFAAYAPDDFTHRFMGEVTAATALRRSLNLPAVALLRRYGPARFAAHLAAAGASLSLPRGAAPSLSLALGGAGISARRLAALYAALATDGAVVRLHLRAGQRRPAHPLLSGAIAAEVADVLTRPLPDSTEGGIAWKTGTSAGNRDDWAVGFDRRHVVLVWVGRPDGGALAGAAAIERVVPILHQVFALLPPAPRTVRPLPAPRDLAAGPAEAPLRLAAPSPNAVVAALGPVALRAVGGRRPLIFLVDGAPIASIPALRVARWRPAGPGFYRIRILDAEGRSVRARVRVVAAAAP